MENQNKQQIPSLVPEYNNEKAYQTNKTQDIIGETDEIEEMLETTTSASIASTPTLQQHIVQQYTLPNYCNYCQRLNHTWDICRTRINIERNTKIFNHPRSNNCHYQANTTNYNQNCNQDPQNNYNTFNQPNTYHTQQQAHAMNYIQNYNENTNYPPPKYCSHCKITKGHTFEECRNKLFNKDKSKGHILDPTLRINKLEKQMKELQMKYMTLHSQSIDTIKQPQNLMYQSEHSNGSNTE